MLHEVTCSTTGFAEAVVFDMMWCGFSFAHGVHVLPLPLILRQATIRPWSHQVRFDGSRRYFGMGAFAFSDKSYLMITSLQFKSFWIIITDHRQSQSITLLANRKRYTVYGIWYSQPSHEYSHRSPYTHTLIIISSFHIYRIISIIVSYHIIIISYRFSFISPHWLFTESHMSPDTYHWSCNNVWVIDTYHWSLRIIFISHRVTWVLAHLQQINPRPIMFWCHVIFDFSCHIVSHSAQTWFRLNVRLLPIAYKVFQTKGYISPILDFRLTRAISIGYSS